MWDGVVRAVVANACVHEIGDEGVVEVGVLRVCQRTACLTCKQHMHCSGSHGCDGVLRLTDGIAHGVEGFVK